MDKQVNIYIAGHQGMVGSAIMRKLKDKGYAKILTRSHGDMDLSQQRTVEKYFKTEKPDIVIVAAAKVGGILANNTYRAQFIYENMMIQNNIIHQSYLHGVKKLLFLGSSCIYPRECSQPIKEEYLLTGPLEQTNEPYAIAKIAGIKMCENYFRQYGCDFISVMPTNLYGPNDNFDLASSHVIPALMRKFHEAKMSNAPYVKVWGTGTPRREFLYVDDMATACVHVLDNVSSEELYGSGLTHLNLGTGEDLPISDLAKMISEVVGYKGSIKYDKSKPDGTHQKLLDVSAIGHYKWKSSTSLYNGLKKTYAWFANVK
jgi:GDP-L-fucose synthase